jgi:O-antigen ligase
MSFWDDEQYQSRLPYWMVHGSAHDGYLEEYIGGGWIGIFFLVVMLLGVSFRVNNALKWDGDYGAFRLAVFSIFLIHNFSECNIAYMTPIGFLFLTAAIGHARSFYQSNTVIEEVSVADDWEPMEKELARTVVLRRHF